MYCAPCLLLLGLGATHGAAVRRRLGGVHELFGATRPRSVPAAVALLQTRDVVHGCSVLTGTEDTQAPGPRDAVRA